MNKAQQNYQGRYCLTSIEKFGPFSSIAEFYRDLKTFPVLKWWSLNETGDLNFLCAKEGLIDLNLAEHKILELRREFISRFGITRTACAYYEKTIQIEIEKNKRVLSPDSCDEMLIEILKRELDDLLPKKEDNADSNIREIEKYMGFQVGSWVSVFDYYEYIEFIKKDAKKN